MSNASSVQVQCNINDILKRMLPSQVMIINALRSTGIFVFEKMLRVHEKPGRAKRANQLAGNCNTKNWQA